MGAALIAVGVAFITPAFFAAVVTQVDAGERGAAVGTASVFIDLAFGGGPLLFGTVAAISGIPFAFGAGAALSAGGAVAAWLIARRGRFV